ncbi:hypothetical protein C8R43DRAFT_1233744, partial [Mycena crocata]
MHHLLQLSFSLTYPLSLHLSSFRTTTTAAISFPVLPANWERSPTWVRVYSTATPPGTSTPRSDPPGGKINIFFRQRPTPARPVANFRRVVADVDYYDYYIYRRPASRDKFQPPRSGGACEYTIFGVPASEVSLPDFYRRRPTPRLALRHQPSRSIQPAHVSLHPQAAAQRRCQRLHYI